MAEMTRDEVNAWLDNGPRWIRLATNGRDGYPHVVPLGYFRIDDDIYLNMRGQRLANVKRDPKVCLVLDAGEGMGDLKGAVIQGDATVIEDQAQVLELQREGLRRRGVPEDKLPTENRGRRPLVRVTPRKIASWDNSKQ
ncbi:MAG: pyridoxamine 5'-phosphate oxidase family protein [Dehalococcoidia bacterium]